MAKLSQTDLPDCWILDRATVKWHRRKFVVVGIMDLQSRKLLAWEIVKPLQPKPVAALLTATVTRYGIPPALVFGVDKVFRSPEVQDICTQLERWPLDLRHGKVSITIFMRSLWRNLEWEGLSWRDPSDEAEFRRLIADWFVLYNSKRPHQALGYDTPDQRWQSTHTQPS